jgi:hypothetical protein
MNNLPAGTVSFVHGPGAVAPDLPEEAGRDRIEVDPPHFTRGRRHLDVASSR